MPHASTRRTCNGLETISSTSCLLQLSSPTQAQDASHHVDLVHDGVAICALGDRQHLPPWAG